MESVTVLACLPREEEERVWGDQRLVQQTIPAVVGSNRDI